MEIMNQLVEVHRRSMLQDEIQRLEQALRQTQLKYIQDLKAEQDNAQTVLSEQNASFTARVDGLLAESLRQSENWQKNQDDLVASANRVHEEEIAQLRSQLDEKTTVINELQKPGPIVTTFIDPTQFTTRTPPIVDLINESLMKTEGNTNPSIKLMWKSHTGPCKTPPLSFSFSGRDFLICGPNSRKGYVP